MSSATTAPTAPMLRTMAILSIAFPLLALWMLGQDRNWDLQNYHLYNPHAWLHGRLRLDIAPAQLQSWHNPLLDVPMYAMNAAHWPAVVIGVWLALPSMAALFLLLRTYSLLSLHPAGRLRVAMLAVLAMGGVGFFSVVGTCLNDAYVAASALACLYLLLLEDPEADRARIWCLAGAIAGATAGLKLTAAVYCLALAGAAIAWPSWRRLPTRLGALLLGGIAGFALTYGYWGTLLYHLHGNPFFPYYNQIFHSPDAAIAPNTDVRFRPASLLDALLIPIRLLAKSQRYSEMNLKDPRLLLGLLASIALPWRARTGAALRDAGRIARTQAFAGFFVVAFLAWSIQYGIYRYAIPLELLGCLGFVLMFESLPEKRLDSGTLIGCLLAVAMSYPVNWGRSHFEWAYVDVQMPRLPHDAMVVMSGGSPLAYAVTALPDDVAAIAIDNTLIHPGDCTTLAAAARERIANHVGPLWLLRGNSADDDSGQARAQSNFGLVVADSCVPVKTTFETLRLCPLRRDATRQVRHAPACATTASAPGR